MNEEDLGDIIKKKDEELLDKYKKQQNPQDPNVLEEELKKREQYKQLPLFTRLNDAIDTGFQRTGEFIANAAQDQPGIGDDIVRRGLQGLSFVGNLPVIKQIGQFEDKIVEGVGNLADRQSVIDPRSFRYATRVGTMFIPYAGAAKVLGKGKAASKVAKVANVVDDATFDAQRLQSGLKMRLLNSIDPDNANIGKFVPQPRNIPQKSQNFTYSVYKRSNRGLLKQLDTQGVLQEAEDIVMKLDDFKQSKGASQGYAAKFNPGRPTTGFKGPRTVKYTDKSGNASEVAFRWSITKNTYIPYDLLKRNETILRRLRWNVNRSTKAKWYSDKIYSASKADNAVLRQLLKELRAEDPVRYFDIMGDTRKYATNKGFIFVEHIHAQNSPFWKYMNPSYKPRDTKNLMIVKNEEFGKLKTSIEREIYDNKNFTFPEGKRLLLDYDRTRDVLVLKQLQDNLRLKWMGDISPITNPTDWRKALKAALKGHKIEPAKRGEIQQVIQANPNLPPYVDMLHGITKEDLY